MTRGGLLFALSILASTALIVGWIWLGVYLLSVSVVGGGTMLAVPFIGLFFFSWYIGSQL